MAEWTLKAEERDSLPSPEGAATTPLETSLYKNGMLLAAMTVEWLTRAVVGNGHRFLIRPAGEYAPMVSSLSRAAEGVMDRPGDAAAHAEWCRALEAACRRPTTATAAAGSSGSSAVCAAESSRVLAAALFPDAIGRTLVAMRLWQGEVALQADACSALSLLLEDALGADIFHESPEVVCAVSAAVVAAMTAHPQVLAVQDHGSAALRRLPHHRGADERAVWWYCGWSRCDARITS